MGFSEKTRRIAISNDSAQLVFDPENVSLPTVRYVEEPWIPNIEDAHEVVVGRYYNVPCTLDPHRHDFSMFHRLNRIVPIIGPLHEDREFIKFPDLHYHIDWRFVSALFLEDGLVKYRENQPDANYKCFKQPQASVIVPARASKERSTRCFAHFKNRDGSYRGPVIRRVLRCKRLFAEFPAEAFWIGGLQLKYRDARVCNDICPHRGISLKGVESTDGGCSVVCPGHGLRWDKRTGRLVSRASERTFDDRS